MFLKAKMTYDSHKIYVEVATMKISSRKILGKDKVEKINSQAKCPKQSDSFRIDRGSPICQCMGDIQLSMGHEYSLVKKSIKSSGLPQSLMVK